MKKTNTYNCIKSIDDSSVCLMDGGEERWFPVFCPIGGKTLAGYWKVHALYCDWIGELLLKADGAEYREVWYDINIPELWRYQISSQGRVRRFYRMVRGVKKADKSRARHMKEKATSTGIVFFSLAVDNARGSARTFHREKPGGKVGSL